MSAAAAAGAWRMKRIDAVAGAATSRSRRSSEARRSFFIASGAFRVVPGWRIEIDLDCLIRLADRYGKSQVSGRAVAEMELAERVALRRGQNFGPGREDYRDARQTLLRIGNVQQLPDGHDLARSALLVDPQIERMPARLVEGLPARMRRSANAG